MCVLCFAGFLLAVMEVVLLSLELPLNQPELVVGLQLKQLLKC
jgi:hypothetical protein